MYVRHDPLRWNVSLIHAGIRLSGHKLLLLPFQLPMVTTESGLQFKDIKVGQGPSPPIGFQVLIITSSFCSPFRTIACQRVSFLITH